MYSYFILHCMDREAVMIQIYNLIIYFRKFSKIFWGEAPGPEYMPYIFSYLQIKIYYLKNFFKIYGFAQN